MLDCVNSKPVRMARHSDTTHYAAIDASHPLDFLPIESHLTYPLCHCWCAVADVLSVRLDI